MIPDVQYPTPRFLQKRRMFFSRPWHYTFLLIGVMITFLVYHIIDVVYLPDSLSTVHRLSSSVQNIIGLGQGSDSDMRDGGKEPPAYLHFTTPSTSRVADTTDVFAQMKHQDICQISSLDLHIPFEPLCPDRASLLRAMSWGGRPGIDAPYIPYGCDMRFYTPEEICSILSRFSRVILIGDSIIRHLTNAFWILLRGDMGYGALRRWDIPKWRNDTAECACGNQYADTTCNNLSFRQRDWRIKQQDLLTEDDFEHVCGRGEEGMPLDLLVYQVMLDYPLNQAYLDELTSRMPQETPSKPLVFVMGHELWNDVDVNKTELWMDQVLDTVSEARPAYADSIPKLYLSTNAGGPGKPKRFLKTQSINKMATFETSIQPRVEDRGIEFLGMYNMSVQSTSTDGTHANLETNLLKAMMVLNYLDNLPYSQSDSPGSWLTQ